MNETTTNALQNARETLEKYKRANKAVMFVEDAVGELESARLDDTREFEDLDDLTYRVERLIPDDDELRHAVHLLVQDHLVGCESELLDAKDTTVVGENDNAWYLIVQWNGWWGLDIPSELWWGVVETRYQPSVRDALNRNPEFDGLSPETALHQGDGYALVLAK